MNKKKIIKAVRIVLIENDKIIAIKYKKEIEDYYDIPGGKIEGEETSAHASVRKFKEETGIDIISQEYKGHVIIEYSDMIFDLDIFIVKEYKGEPLEFEKNYSMWKNIDELLIEPKVIPSIEIVRHFVKNSKENMNFRVYSNKEHKIIKIEEE